jgi:peptidoglycan/LPS O-acetylase OafA/YrhL
LSADPPSRRWEAGSPNPIPPDLSAFIDLLRLSAAAVVFLAHLSSFDAGGRSLPVTGTLAHSAVVVFFVISGYVIASAARRDGSAAGYAVSRAARIYSVALPALALTFILDVATGNTSYQHAQPWKYLPLFLGFATDWWFLTENAFSNVPYWSLSYEVWYYVIFGIALFARGWRDGFSSGSCWP